MSEQKLHEVFQKLTDEHNIFAPQYPYQCCSSCAWAYFNDNQKHDGMVFYHEQDAEHSSLYSDVMLGFGLKGLKLSEDSDLQQFGYLIVQLLNENGLETIWDGNINTRINVLNVTLESPFEEEMCQSCGWNEADDWDGLCYECRYEEEDEMEDENEF